MEHIAPLIQTVLWVGFLAVILWRYHTAIGNILSALQKRIEQGGGLKAGFFEIPEFRPQNAEQQKQRLEAEVQQVAQVEQLEDSPEEMSLPPDVRTATDPTTTKRRVLQAEDLALRAIQSEYGTVIGRQLQIGSDLQFDGVFHKQARSYVVEVKYARRRYPRALLLQTVERLVQRLKTYTSNFELIVAIVYGHEFIDPKAEQDRLSQALRDYDGVTKIRCYTLPELTDRFGVEMA